MADPVTTTECPPISELERLVRGRLTEARTACLCEHIGGCPKCQERLEQLTGSAVELTRCLREVEQEKPPNDSAYWRALAAAENEARSTTLFPTNGEANTPPPEDEMKLDFLQPPDNPGRLGKLGQFEVIRVVGRGGMGVVLHAYDPCLQRDVAVKVIDPKLANNEVARQRFCREARAAAAVTHENLVAVHQVDEDEGSGLPYLVMQLVTGESLEQRLKRAGKLSVVEVARLGMQAAAGLAAAHASGLIHRDIKPANILLESSTDRVKLTDFGLARAAEDVKLTRTGFVAGSPLYMAPEQARGDEVDHRADLFSLGTVLYEAATGKAPFDGKTPLVVLRRVADETQTSLVTINPDIPQWLSDTVDRLLEKDPAQRYQSAAEVAEVFAAGLAEMRQLSPLDVPAEVCSASRSATAHKRAPICWKKVGHCALPWGAGAVMGGLVVGLLWLLFGQSEATPTPQPEPQIQFVEREPAVVPLVVPIRLNPPAPEPGPEPKLTLPGEAGAVWGISFFNKDRLVMGMEDGSAKIWNLTTGEPVRTLRLEGTVWTVDVSADGKYLLTACDNKEVPQWNLNTYQTEVKYPHPTAAKAAVFRPDGKFIATGDRNATVRVWNVDNPVPVELLGHRGTVHALAYSPDGNLLASAGSDRAVRVWNLKDVDWSKREVTVEPLELTEHRGPVYGLAFSPDSSKLASAGWDGTVRIWDTSNGALLQTIKAHNDDVWSVSFGGDGKWVASAGSDKFVKVWDVSNKEAKEVFNYQGTRAFHVVRFAPDGTTLAAGGRDGNVRVWDVK
ncbi:MAG: serine/threonine protein kinase [Planctomycetia bacterium]|nr:serine/threonine protein kinase [Planctomycetia bacterium]